jgi:aspartyl-tRNA(Asn)/glutamyl-tRNA(Gln) amidotransferase subunit A
VSRRPGLTLAVKDLFDTDRLTTTYGSIIFAEHVPPRTASAVLRLERAGLAIVGKTNLDEFAYGVTSQNPHFGAAPNPLDPTRTAGGSSGGSAAAVAAGLAELALGTDSAGSIRIPAACCGVVGFKPTHGLVSLEGCFPLAPSFDHAGPIARTSDACAAAMEMLAPTFRRRSLRSLEEVTVGVAWTSRAEQLVRRQVESAAAHFPRRRLIAFPLPAGIDAGFMHEVAEVHRDLFATHRDAYGENVRRKLERCMHITDGQSHASHRARGEYRDRALTAFEGFDLLITPTLPFVAPPLGVDEALVRDAMIRFTRPFNALGWPALALPCGTADGGLPASLQIVGRPGNDPLVLAAAELLESRLRAVRECSGRDAISAGPTALISHNRWSTRRSA